MMRAMTIPLVAVVALAATGSAWAVGDGQILHWDDARWSRVAGPTTGDPAAVAVHGGRGASETEAGSALTNGVACLPGQGAHGWHPGSIQATATRTATDTPSATVTHTPVVAVTATRPTHTTVPSASPTATRTATRTATATRTPRPTTTPTSTITPGPSPTPTATPLVRGSVDLRLARPPTSCRGVELVGVFSATSAVALVSQMRTSLVETNGLGCYRNRVDPDVLRAAWRPFFATEDYRVDAGPHYYMFALGVQYRDNLGNVSPVYCASIMGVCLATPTLSPTPVSASATPTAAPRWHLYLSWCGKGTRIGGG